MIVQGITGTQGRFHALRNRAYGTQIVAGVTPGRGGAMVDGIPVYDSVSEALLHHEAEASLVVVPPAFAPGAILEAAGAGISLIVCITEGIALHDEARCVAALARDHPRVRLIGPNSPGILSPGAINIGITAGEAALAGGPVGIVSRSGTLTYQAIADLSGIGIGQTTCVGIGGDPLPGTSFVDCLEAFGSDPDTQAVLLIGEIGGSAEEEAASYVASGFAKPVVSYVAGRSAPEGRHMGHAGAIVSGGRGGAAAKIAALESAGVLVAPSPAEAARMLAELLSDTQTSGVEP